MTDILLEGERLDDLERNGYKIIQHKDKFCFGMDAVLLTGFADVYEGENVIDLGTGTGIIPILLEAKTKKAKTQKAKIQKTKTKVNQEESEKNSFQNTEVNSGDNRPRAHFTALEIQEESADMASRSVKYNNLTDYINIVNGDIKEASMIFKKASFDVVTSNPPYMNDQHGLKNPDLPKAIARHEVLCTLDDVVREASKLLRPGGRFYMVHRPHRLTELICTLKQYKLEPKRIQFVHPFIDRDANMVMIESVRGGKSMIKVEKPIIVYKEPGIYTDEIYEIYGY